MTTIQVLCVCQKKQGHQSHFQYRLYGHLDSVEIIKKIQILVVELSKQSNSGIL